MGSCQLLSLALLCAAAAASPQSLNRDARALPPPPPPPPPPPSSNEVVIANFNCLEPNGTYAHDNQCDKYYQCIDGVAQERTCQDGLLFHPERPYPCVYPQEVDCLARSGIQDPQPTEDCPRQFALFRTSDAPADCSGFTSCVNGRAFRADCPETLAYNARTLLCQWADEVEDCDAAGYLGFQCPAQEFSPDQVGEFTRQPHPDDCTKYYICLNKEDGSVKPRLQGCPEPTVFDPAKDACNENIEEVPGCENAIAPEVLAAYRDRQAQEDARREARLQEVRSTLDG
ncbi:protein obstructor-E-like [Pollicipes pollicipes]|uniref:protein obstructor-E-like n=1 Tax=Pollicipes pollicipes TaxID=41117 RepID=UPI0018858697|nr:protein obstructor-E-like [Pollicipes pollicipes]